MAVKAINTPKPLMISLYRSELVEKGWQKAPGTVTQLAGLGFSPRQLSSSRPGQLHLNGVSKNVSTCLMGSY